MPINRRQVLALLSSSSFFFTAGGKAETLNAKPASGGGLSFPQGVASGDPQSDSVMLWTRAVPADTANKVVLLLQISEEPSFSQLLLSKTVSTNQSSDFTLRAYVNGLHADRSYYYRFVGSSQTSSRVGRTRTAPAADTAKATKLAFVSCQSYEQSYYGAWARMLADDEAAAEDQQIQFVLHLGDFIYERCWHARFDGSPQSRYVPPFPDGASNEHNRHAVSLADYRHLYKTYLSDPWLQAARARWPFINTWDDHEFSDDNYQSYSSYGGSSKLEARRKLDSNRAWFEYIPTLLDEVPKQCSYGFRDAVISDDAETANRQARDSLKIYRKFNWGKLLDIVLTDNRSYRSPPCVDEKLASSLGLPMNTVRLVDISDGGRDYQGGKPSATLPYGDGDTTNPARNRDPGSCLGAEQREWLLAELSNSSATWKLWGNSLPLMPLRVDLSSVPLAGYEDAVFNVDAWSGYPSEARAILDHLEEQHIGGLVSLSGDHHMHGASALYAQERAVGADFSCAGISSSPLFQSVMYNARKGDPAFHALVFNENETELQPVWDMTLLRGVLASFAYSKIGSASLANWLGPNPANKGLQFVESNSNGYGLAYFRADALEIELVAMEDMLKDFERTPAIRYRAHFRLPAWSGEASAVLEGPTFSGKPPFPFNLS